MEWREGRVNYSFDSDTRQLNFWFAGHSLETHPTHRRPLFEVQVQVLQQVGLELPVEFGRTTWSLSAMIECTEEIIIICEDDSGVSSFFSSITLISKVFQKYSVGKVDEISLSHQCTVMLRTLALAFRRLPRLEVFRNTMDPIAVASCNVLLSVAVGTKASSSRTVSRVACRGVDFLANFLRFWDGRDIHVFYTNSHSAINQGYE